MYTGLNINKHMATERLSAYSINLNENFAINSQSMIEYYFYVTVTEVRKCDYLNHVMYDFLKF